MMVYFSSPFLKRKLKGTRTILAGKWFSHPLDVKKIELAQQQLAGKMLEYNQNKSY
jgi:hypothetical protein